MVLPPTMKGNFHHRSHLAGSCSQSTTHPLKEPSEVASLPFSVIMCEAVAIYGVIMAIILQGKMNQTEMYDNNYPELVFAGYALFWTGITVGFSNLACGYSHR